LRSGSWGDDQIR
jgi:hypothetical protein